MEEAPTPSTAPRSTPKHEPAKPELAETEAKAEPGISKSISLAKEYKNPAVARIKATEVTPRRRLGIKA